MLAPSKSRTHYLLIDVSNSFTKLAFATRRTIGRPVRIPTAELSSAALKRHLRRKQIDHIVACSVVPKRNVEIERGAGATKVLWLTPRLDLGVTIDFPEPQRNRRGSVGQRRSGDETLRRARDCRGFWNGCYL
jgi:type III pantothenate kinase